MSTPGRQPAHAAAEPPPAADSSAPVLRSEKARHLLAILIVTGASAVLAVTVNRYGHEARGKGLLGLELGGGKAAAALAGTPGRRSELRDVVRWDFLLIAGYATFLSAGCFLARWMLHARRVRRWVAFGLFAAATTVAADIAENLLLLRALSGSATLLAVNLYDVAAVLAVVKFCAFLPAAVTALTAMGLAVVRFRPPSGRTETLGSDDYQRPLPVLCTDPAAEAGTGTGTGTGNLNRWARGYHIPRCSHARSGSQADDVIGIGLSGGGVRAASVALGVLQSQPFRTEVVSKADYLVSVSGGGYTAGAFAHALTHATPSEPACRRRGPAGQSPSQATPDAVIRDPDSVFMVGSPEEDHLRRNSSYIANRPSQMVAALGLLAGHLLMTLTLLFGPAILLGVLAGILYRWVPITLFHWSRPNQTGQLDPLVRSSSLWALAIAAVLTLLGILALQFFPTRSDRSSQARRRRVVFVGEGLVGLTAMIALITVALPRIMWLSSWLLDSTHSQVQVASPVAAVLLTYLASLATLVWRRRSLLTRRKPRHGEGGQAPRGLVRIVLVIAALLALVVGWLLVVGGLAGVAYARPLRTADRNALLVLLLVLVLLGWLTDEADLSLHPFYRTRLASAFAVRRIRRGQDGQVVAQPYPPTETTSLSRYGAMAKGTAFPHIIFAASATLGPERTPPGSDRVSYTFCADWVGGPDVGYVHTGKLESLAPPRLGRDLTVQGAMALSGAAIAASVGGQGSAWYDPLLVVSGVRLGAWMPNPTFMIERYPTPRTLTRPGLPRVRRAHYLLRELFGVHTADGPLLHVSDGGFYDNLGMLELFRRGCTRIYCVDASGDSPPVASTLAQSLTRAYQELGIEAKLDASTWSTATAGSGEKLSPTEPLAALSQRLSGTGIITGTFRYPDCGPSAGKSGNLVVAKASLWCKLPYPLMAYAHGATVFPHDSTADQWFDDRQYAAYTELGRCLGEAAVPAMDAAAAPPEGGSGTDGAQPADSQDDAVNRAGKARPPGYGGARARRHTHDPRRQTKSRW